MQGLSNSEVEARIRTGEVNRSNIQKIKTSSIIKKHTLTLFNFIIFILACLIFIFGKKRDVLFVVIAAFSTIIAIINDLRARHIVEKLNLVSELPVVVIRNNQEVKIPPENIVKSDIMKISLGNQIVVDAKIISGELEVNESFITGESNNLKKRPGDNLISGSFVVSGNCLAKVTAVGDNSYISKILKTAKQSKTKRSKLFLSIDKIIRIGSFVIIPVGILLLLKQLFLSAATIESAITSTVAAIVAMIPEGLILLTSSVLALATIRLAKQNVLIQDFYTIETLARVDTICLDKTGTLTTGNMKVNKIIPVGNHSESEIKEHIAAINGSLEATNPTAKALLKKFGKKSIRASEPYHFSSDKKFSGVRIGKKKLLIGALDFLTTDKTFENQEKELAKTHRVLTVMRKDSKKEEILGFVLLSDEIRPSAKDLLDFFKKNSIRTKIISGDNLPTIEKILVSLNFSPQKSVDLSTISHPNYNSLAVEYDIFARANPEQKKLLIRALKNAGHTVAMTGDGVNDCLALREADCGISIGDGTDATRRVSDIVLLNNDFLTIPSIVFEGRRAINNIVRSSALFLNKTIFATVLGIIYIFLNFRYPFSPIEMSLINTVTIGIPSFILALEPNFSQVTNNFKRHILINSLPAALAAIFSTISISIISNLFKFSWTETISLSYLLTSFIGLLLIYKISRPLKKLHKILLSTLAAILILVLLISPFRNFFGLSFVSPTLLIVSLILGIISIIILAFSSRFLSHRSI